MKFLTRLFSREVLTLFPKRVRDPKSPIKNLYVIKVDFPVTKQRMAEIDDMLDPIRKKYGLDFLLLEPGIKFVKFDDI